MLEWVKGEVGDGDFNEYCAWGVAARGGHFHILKWLRAQGFDWSALACYGAAQGGHLEVLRWFVILFFSLAAFFDLASDPAILPSEGCERRAAHGKAKPWTQQQDEAT